MRVENNGESGSLDLRCSQCQVVMGTMRQPTDGSETWGLDAGECGKDHLELEAGGMVLRCPGCGRLVEVDTVGIAPHGAEV